tara:strand:+ start:4365 stop:5192 length:828 start_codon:yes stop_codon:yes gene_type:complete
MKKFSKLLFGTPGIPGSSTKVDSLHGVKRVHELGLDAMEMEWVHQVPKNKEKIEDVGKMASSLGVVLTCHAPYYINLNSPEPAKKYASIYRIVNSAEMLQLASGWSVCYHPGFYLKMDPKVVYKTMVKRFKAINLELKKKKIDIWVRPETTGKPTQFGSFDELLRICKECNTLPVVDFSHVHARDNGGWNSKKEWVEMLSKMEKKLGRVALDNMHIHISGIEYGEKGEKKHLILEESDLKWKDLLKVWKEFKLKGVCITESPNLEEETLLIKKSY